MNSSTMHHVGTARMEQHIAAAEASRLAREARRARSASKVPVHHPIDWVRQLTATVAHAFSSRRAAATGH